VNFRKTPRSVVWITAAFALGVSLASGAISGSDNSSNPRQLYNDGTLKFHEGKLGEAETFLQSAVASQNEDVQVPALYNLGCVRFKEGEQELKNELDGGATRTRADRAYEMGGAAIHAADSALAADDFDAIVAAYRQGRGASKELKTAAEAVKRAMESHGAVLSKWQRASGDFKSAHELNPKETDAEFNAGVVDRHIAKLVDLQQMMMQSAAGLGKQRQELREKLRALKKKMPQQPGEQNPGGQDEDDDGDEDKPPKEPKAGVEEGPSKDGKAQQLLTPEEAAHWLEMLKLDTNRKLPLGLGDTGATPKDRKRRDW
jgi:hypothetical protein